MIPVIFSCFICATFNFRVMLAQSTSRRRCEANVSLLSVLRLDQVAVVAHHRFNGRWLSPISATLVHVALSKELPLFPRTGTISTRRTQLNGPTTTCIATQLNQFVSIMSRHIYVSIRLTVVSHTTLDFTGPTADTVNKI